MANEADSKDLNPSQYPEWLEFTPVGDGVTRVTPRADFSFESAGSSTISDALGLPFDGGDSYGGMKEIIALSHKVGQLISMEIEDPPVAWAASQSSDNPSNSEYNPVIPRHDADHDVASTQAPLLVTKFRAIKAKVGTTLDFLTASVVGSVITLANNATNAKFIAALVNAAMVNRYYTAGKVATWAAGGVDFASATRAYCVNDGTADFTIASVNQGTLAITVTGSPASVASISCYPFRIAGEALKIRLRRLDGFALVAGGSDTTDPLISFLEMDHGHAHWHGLRKYSGIANASFDVSQYLAAADSGGQSLGRSTADQTNTVSVQGAIADASNGTPRMGKSTEVKRLGVALYTWARTLLATDWT